MEEIRPQDNLEIVDLVKRCLALDHIEGKGWVYREFTKAANQWLEAPIAVSKHTFSSIAWRSERIALMPGAGGPVKSQGLAVKAVCGLLNPAWAFSEEVLALQIRIADEFVTHAEKVISESGGA